MSASPILPAAEPENDSGNIVLHVLCPTLPSPNRFTINGLAPSTTVATLKARLSQSVPSHPDPETQRLFYMGKPVLNNDATLQTVLGTLDGPEFYMHLVLPPAPQQAASSARSLPADRTPLRQNALFSNRFEPNHMPQGQELRYRGPTAPNPSNEGGISLALQQHPEAIRRHLDAHERGVLPRQQSQEAIQAATSNVRQLGSMISPWQRTTAGVSHPSPLTTRSSSASPMSPPPHLPQFRTPNIGLLQPTEILSRLQFLTQQVLAAEEHLNRGVAPPLDHVIHLRTQLLDLLDDQYRRPLTERIRSIEPLLNRVFNISARGDQLRSAQTGVSNLHTSPPNTMQSQSSLYLLSSPDGFQAVVAPPNTVEAMQTSLDALRARISTPNLSNSSPQPNLQNGQPNGQVNANAAVFDNVVRQAVLNQQPAQNNDQLGLARNLRRVWLFVRLYFFCYLLSEPETWTRIIYVALAVIVSILSETNIPRQLYQSVLAPVQRHLEGLVHFPPEEHTRQRTQRTEPAGEAAMNRQVGLSAELRHNIRRVERSLALFIASLVPGVGERHVQVRNAAEAARAAREEEERRRREEAEREQRAQQEQQEQPSQRPEDNSITNADANTNNVQN